jgi:hypothetical protein
VARKWSRDCDVQAWEVILHGSEEEVGVLAPDLRQVDVLEQRGREGGELVLETEKILLGGGRGEGEACGRSAVEQGVGCMAGEALMATR